MVQNKKNVYLEENVFTVMVKVAIFHKSMDNINNYYENRYFKRKPLNVMFRLQYSAPTNL